MLTRLKGEASELAESDVCCVDEKIVVQECVKKRTLLLTALLKVPHEAGRCVLNTKHTDLPFNAVQ